MMKLTDFEIHVKCTKCGRCPVRTDFTSFGDLEDALLQSLCPDGQCVADGSDGDLGDPPKAPMAAVAG